MRRRRDTDVRGYHVAAALLVMAATLPACTRSTIFRFEEGPEPAYLQSNDTPGSEGKDDGYDARNERHPRHPRHRLDD